MFTKDYIMRQIEMMGKAIAMIFDKKETSFEVQLVDSFLRREYMLESEIEQALADGYVNDAEDLLFDYMEKFRGVDFSEQARYLYSRLNDMTDEQLKRANFSRQEINDGVEAVIVFYKNLDEDILGG